MKIKMILLVSILFLINNSAFAYSDNFLFDAYLPTFNKCEDNIADNIQKHQFKKLKKSLSCLSENKQNAEYYIFNSEVEMQSNNIDSAEQYLKNSLKYIDKSSNKYLVYNQFAKLYLAKADYIKALEYSDKAFESPHLEKEFIETRINILSAKPLENPPSIVKWRAIFSAFDYDEKYLDRDEDWNKILDTIKKADELYQNNSNISLGESLGLTDNQVKRYNEKTSNQKKCLARIASYELPLGYYNDALKHIQEALNVAPDKEKDFLLYTGELEIYEYKEEFNKIIDLTTDLLGKYYSDKETEQLYLGRAMSYMQLKKYNLALVDIEKCLEKHPKNLKLLELKGFALIGCEKYFEALQVFLEISEKDKDFKLSDDVLKAIVSSTNNYEMAMKAINRMSENKNLYSDYSG